MKQTHRTLSRSFTLTAMLLLTFFISMADYSQANAAAAPQGSQKAGTAMSALNQVCQVNMVNKQGEIRIFSVGVKCFENVVNGIAEETIVGFSNFLQTTVYSLLVLYLVFFGAKVTLGISAGDKLKGEFMIHGLKIAFVAWLVFSFGLLDIYGMVLSTYQSLLNLVLVDMDLGECSGAGGFLTTGTEAIWLTMDCMFSKFIGYEAKNGFGTNFVGIPLLFGFITSKLAPANGFVIGGLLFGTVWAMLMSFFRLAFVYILSMMALILLFSIAPLMVPMILFQQTKAYFEGWYKLIISMIMQPVILFAFFGFIASLLSETITKMMKIFEDAKPTIQTSGITNLGSARDFQTAFSMVGDAVDKIDKDLLLSGITTLVIAYLLISFISFVGRMAQELAGTGTSPNLNELTPKLVNPK